MRLLVTLNMVGYHKVRELWAQDELTDDGWKSQQAGRDAAAREAWESRGWWETADADEGAQAESAAQTESDEVVELKLGSL
jgi:hypothetical protein